MSSNYPTSDPRWQMYDDGDDDEGSQDNTVSYPYYNANVYRTLPEIDDDGEPGPSASYYNLPTEDTYEHHPRQSYTHHDSYPEGYDPHHDDVDYRDYAPIETQFQDPSATSSESVDPDSLTRANTMGTDISTWPNQGSVQGLSDSDSDDDQRGVRVRDPAQQDAAVEDFNPPLPVGYRYAFPLMGMAGNMPDIGSSFNMPIETVKKNGKREKDNETSSSYDNSSSGGRRKKRRDDDEKDTPRK